MNMAIFNNWFKIFILEIQTWLLKPFCSYCVKILCLYLKTDCPQVACGSVFASRYISLFIFTIFSHSKFAFICPISHISHFLDIWSSPLKQRFLKLQNWDYIDKKLRPLSPLNKCQIYPTTTCSEIMSMSSLLLTFYCKIVKNETKHSLKQTAFVLN